MQRSTAIAIIVTLIVVAVGAALLVNGASGNNQSSQPAGDSRQADEHQTETTNQPGQPETATATTEVEIEDFAYQPATIRIKVGDTVTWTNKDSDQHNVVSDDSSADGPDGPLLARGESYSFTFKKAGTYNYHCNPHPYMKGTVIVK